MATQATLGGVPLKYISLVTLTVQNSMLTILLRYSRTSPSAKPYSAPAAVLLNEILKGAISLFMALRTAFSQPTPQSHLANGATNKVIEAFEDRRRSTTGTPTPTWWTSPDGWRTEFVPRLHQISRAVFSRDCWKLSIPAILYVIQNNLQFVAASNLDVASFQVTYQLKILTTALCSVLMLKRRLNMAKWWALLFLAVGVALVQLANLSTTDAGHSAQDSGDPVTGFIAVLAACVTSGLAGVYFELVLKGSNVDLWVRNVQLSFFSLLPALFTAFVASRSATDEYAGLPIVEEVIGENGKLIVITHDPPPFVRPWLFANFGFWAWSTVLCQVIGGLVTALVIKFADNILKGFATSLSIVLSFLAGVVLFDFKLSWGFTMGASTVLASTYMYNRPHRPDVSAAGGGGASAGALDNGFSVMTSKSRRPDGTSSPLPLHNASPHNNHHLPAFPSTPTYGGQPSHPGVATPPPASSTFSSQPSSQTPSYASSGLRGRPATYESAMTPDSSPSSHALGSHPQFRPPHHGHDPNPSAALAGGGAGGPQFFPFPKSATAVDVSAGNDDVHARHRPHARSSPSVSEFSTVPINPDRLTPSSSSSALGDLSAAGAGGQGGRRASAVERPASPKPDGSAV